MVDPARRAGTHRARNSDWMGTFWRGTGWYRKNAQEQAEAARNAARRRRHGHAKPTMVYDLEESEGTTQDIAALGGREDPDGSEGGSSEGSTDRRNGSPRARSLP